MSGSGTDAGQTDLGALRSEVARLEAENRELRKSGSEAGSAPGRTRWAIAVAIAAALVAALAVPAVWLNRVVFDTESWVATVAPLAEDPAIQTAVADASSAAMIDRLAARERLEELLPPDLVRFAPLLAPAIENAVRTQAGEVVRSERFAELWREANRSGHGALVRALKAEDGGAVQVESGTVSVDSRALIERVKSELAARGFELASRIPSGEATEIVLFRSSALASVGPALATLSRLALLLPLLALALAAGAFALATERRKVALWLGAGLLLGTVLPVQLIFLAENAVAAQAQSAAGISGDAIRAGYTIIFAGLVQAERALAILGSLLVVAGMLTGETRWALAIRRGYRSGLSGVASSIDMGAVGGFAAGHVAGLRAAGFITATLVLLSLPAPRSIGSIALIASLVLVWLTLVEFAAAAGHSGSRA